MILDDETFMDGVQKDMYIIAEGYYYGKHGQKKSVDKFVKYCKLLSEEGFVNASLSLGKYFNSVYDYENSIIYLETYLKQCKTPDANIYFLLGNIYYKRNNRKKKNCNNSLELDLDPYPINKKQLLILTNDNYDISLSNNFEDDLNKAFKNMNKAADNNYEKAYNKLGLYYSLGIGCEISYSKAIEYFKLGSKSKCIYEKIYGKIGLGYLNKLKNNIEESLKHYESALKDMDTNLEIEERIFQYQIFKYDFDLDDDCVGYGPFIRKNYKRKLSNGETTPPAKKNDTRRK